MKKFFLASALLTTTICQAQVPSVGPYVSYSLFLPHSKNFEEFRTTYNQHFQSSLETPMSDFNVTGAFAFGFDFGFTGIRFSRFNSMAQSKIQGGGGRNLELEQRSLIIPIGVGAYDGGKHFGFYMNVGFTRTALKSSLVYPDGTSSYAFDHYLNGMYTSKGISFAPEIVFGIGRVVYLYGTLSYQIGFLDSELKDETKFDTDKNYFYFPKDPASTDLIPEGLKLNMGGLMLGLGIKVSFIELFDK
jgi:hypothetical protein